MAKSTKTTFDILLRAISLVENKDLRSLILKALEQYNDELLQDTKKIDEALKK
jgi:hypothetical protein